MRCARTSWDESGKEYYSRDSNGSSDQLQKKHTKFKTAVLKMELKRTSWDERRGVYRFTHGHGNARIEVHVLVGTQSIILDLCTPSPWKSWERLLVLCQKAGMKKPRWLGWAWVMLGLSATSLSIPTE